MATKQVGDMIYAYGDPVEVEYVRLHDRIRYPCGEVAARPSDTIKPGEASVGVKRWDGKCWLSEAFLYSGEIELCPCKHVAIPAGEYECRNVNTGDVYRANMEYTVGYQWEVTA